MMLLMIVNDDVDVVVDDDDDDDDVLSFPNIAESQCCSKEVAKCSRGSCRAAIVKTVPYFRRRFQNGFFFFVISVKQNNFK